MSDDSHGLRILSIRRRVRTSGQHTAVLVFFSHPRPVLLSWAMFRCTSSHEKYSVLLTDGLGSHTFTKPPSPLQGGAKLNKFSSQLTQDKVSSILSHLSGSGHRRSQGSRRCSGYVYASPLLSMGLYLCMTSVRHWSDRSRHEQAASMAIYVLSWMQSHAPLRSESRQYGGKVCHSHRSIAASLY